MQFIKNERGSILVFVTLITVLLLIMVGMGLDTGQLTYVRNQGQAAVDAAALAAASALPTNNDAQVKARVASYNSKSFNDYVGEPTNPLGGANITYVAWDPITQSVQNLPSITGANGVRVALEQNNPYTGAASKTGITTPVFLTPLMRLLGQNAPTTSNISVSAVAVLTATPLIPIALYDSLCNGSNTVPNVDLRMESQNPKNACWTTYLDQPVNVPKLRALFDNSGTCSGLPKDLVDVGTDIFVQNGVGATVFNNATNGGSCPNGSFTDAWLVNVTSAASNATTGLFVGNYIAHEINSQMVVNNNNSISVQITVKI